jgi:hypothetical protein
MQLTAAQCREQAEECRRLADAAARGTRNVYLDLTRTWETLANHADRLVAAGVIRLPRKAVSTGEPAKF